MSNNSLVMLPSLKDAISERVGARMFGGAGHSDAKGSPAFRSM